MSVERSNFFDLSNDWFFQELNKKIDIIRDQIYKLPGVERSKEDQLRQLGVLKKQLDCKKKLIAKYKELNLKVCGLNGQPKKSFRTENASNSEEKPDISSINSENMDIGI